VSSSNTSISGIPRESGHSTKSNRSIKKKKKKKKSDSDDINSNDFLSSSHTSISGMPTESGHSADSNRSIKKKKKKKKPDSDIDGIINNDFVSSSNTSISGIPRESGHSTKSNRSIKKKKKKKKKKKDSSYTDGTTTTTTTLIRADSSSDIPAISASTTGNNHEDTDHKQTNDTTNKEKSNSITKKKTKKKKRKEHDSMSSSPDVDVDVSVTAAASCPPSSKVDKKDDDDDDNKNIPATSGHSSSSIKKKKKKESDSNIDTSCHSSSSSSSNNKTVSPSLPKLIKNLDDISCHSSSSSSISSNKMASPSQPKLIENLNDTDDSTRNSLALCNYVEEVTDVDTLMINRLIRAKDGRPGTLVELEEEDIISLCARVQEQFLIEPMLLRTEAPIKICGDIHGQYYDLLRIFDHCGNPRKVNYLFLGDYCDRGKQSIEVLCLLFAYKLKYPNKMHLLRGNHESQQLTRMYGFYDECKRRYSVKLWKRFCAVFDCMPIAAVISDIIFCVHGGLSPTLKSLEQIDSIQRPTDIPETGLMTDLLWSDPEPDISGWEENDRGISYVFGGDVVEEFLNEHNLDLVVRAHQVIEDGYEFFSGRKLVTIFSAPNYCGEFDNCGATMIINTDLKCHFQLLKPSTKKKPPVKALTPVQILQRNTRRIMMAMRFGNHDKAEDFNVGSLNNSKPRTLKEMDASDKKETDVDKKSLERSFKNKSSSNVTSSFVSAPDITDSSRLHFETRALILETENLTGRQTSWGDVWDDLYYNEDELAEFRYEAHIAEVESGEEDEFA